MIGMPDPGREPALCSMRGDSMFGVKSLWLSKWIDIEHAKARISDATASFSVQQQAGTLSYAL